MDNEKTAPKKLVTAFKRASAEIASSWVDGKIKRENSISQWGIAVSIAHVFVILCCKREWR